jgi:hypothetical protein
MQDSSSCLCMPSPVAANEMPRATAPTDSEDVMVVTRYNQAVCDTCESAVNCRQIDLVTTTREQAQARQVLKRTYAFSSLY